MPRIELKNITKHILKEITLTVEDRETLALVGPNGSGKTTILNIIAGLTDYKGEVFFDGRNIDHIPPHKRGVGYLFQDLALFPHLTVASNIAYGLRIQHYPEETITARVDELMNALHIKKLRERYPQGLSGGEKQRVAIARAIAPFQKILLLDEPTSSLDTQTSKYLRIELCTLLKKLDITAIFVMHDLLGAEEVADRIAILHKGTIEQISRPGDILFNPQTKMVSEFIGMPNILNCDNCRVLSSGLIEVVSGNMTIVLPYEGSTIRKIAIPPHDIYISDTKPPGPALNRYRATITEIVPLRSVVRIKVNINGSSLLTELSMETFDEMNLDIGQEVFVIIKLRRLRYVEEFEDSRE
ncbi:MAG: ABC transporter ATP-binding protein [Syntrophorhabdaceae bacterium]|nr:ABC transporter ATP-binding protein [Syntrophorhabdaceae bacterium]MDD5243298.1 ABC transporter ATP-binding protein [Syntrophorhabdaceae bacterium]